MSEDEGKKEQKIKVGEKISIIEKVTVIKIRKEATEELNKLPVNLRNKVLEKAVKLTMKTDHPYDVTLDEVTKAKKGVENG